MSIGGDLDNVDRMDTSSTKLEIIHGRLGGDVRIDSLGVPEIANTFVFDRVNDEGMTGTFSSFVQIEIVPKIFVEGIGEGADNGSGIVGYDRVDNVPFGRGRHFVL